MERVLKRGLVFQGSDALTRAASIVGQKTGYSAPYAIACRAPGVSQSWFFKWHCRPATLGQRRDAELDKAVAEMLADLAADWQVHCRRRW